MTDKKIIKVLECLGGCALNCRECPYSHGYFFPLCQQQVSKDALDLINRQQEQLEVAIAGQETLQKALAEKNREVKQLTAEKEQLIKAFGECQAEATKAEAIREFAERLKGTFPSYNVLRFTNLISIDIDNLVKEMAGDKE